MNAVFAVHLAIVLIVVEGQSALKAIHGFHPDAIVNGVEMSNLNGLELLRGVRSSENPFVREIPVIVGSSNTDAETCESWANLPPTQSCPNPLAPPGLPRPRFGASRRLSIAEEKSVLAHALLTPRVTGKQCLTRNQNYKLCAAGYEIVPDRFIRTVIIHH